MNIAGTIVDDSVDDDPEHDGLHCKPALQGSKRNKRRNSLGDLPH